MEYKISFHPKAIQDWTNVIDWYNLKKENLGFEVYDEIDKYLLLLKENPLHFQKRFQDIRAIFTKRFHFGIYYLVNQNEIFIIAIINTKENIKKVEQRFS